MEDKWHKRYIDLAKEISSWSKDPSTRCGAIFVGTSGQILSQGYNGFLPGCPHDSIVRHGHEQATVHAEQNAICDCAKRGVSCDGATAYITHFPCLICTRLLLASGISEIKYIHDYTEDTLTHYFCNQKQVKLIKINSTKLKET